MHAWPPEEYEGGFADFVFHGVRKEYHWARDDLPQYARRSRSHFSRRELGQNRQEAKLA